MTPEQLLNHLKERRMILATVESCTGGMLASRFTDIAGSSAVFWGSWVTYDNSAKEMSVGVSANTLLAHGAVSEPTAREMAERALEKMMQAVRASRVTGFGAQDIQGGIVIATTGIAGPSGGTSEKPVGLCYIGVAVTGHPTQVFRIQAPQGLSRAEIREVFVQQALRYAVL